MLESRLSMEKPNEDLLSESIPDSIYLDQDNPLLVFDLMGGN